MLKNLPPFSFLYKTVNLMIIDDDPGMVSLYQNYFGAIPLYSIKVARSSAEAVSQFEQPERHHVCIFDLGLDDIRGDEFYLLERFGKHAAFVVTTGAKSPEKGFACYRLGAREVFDKGPEVDYVDYVKRVNFHALLNLVNPLYHEAGRDQLSNATRRLIEKKPELVTDWAMETGVTDRELRHIWKKNLGANTKIILFVYHLYREAFAFFEEPLAEVIRSIDDAETEPSEVDDVERYRHQEEYFHMHRSTILDYIAFGNVVNFTVK